MLRWILAAIAVVLMSFAISAGARWSLKPPDLKPYDPVAYELRRQVDQQFESISMVALIANPERYDGRKVRVAGFLTLYGGEASLHLDRTAYRAGLHKNGLWLRTPRSLTIKDFTKLNGRYAVAAGTFNAELQGPYDFYSGALVDIQLMEPTLTMAEFSQTRQRDRQLALTQHLLSAGPLTLFGWLGLWIIWLVSRKRHSS